MNDDTSSSYDPPEIVTAGEIIHLTGAESGTYPDVLTLGNHYTPEEESVCTLCHGNKRVQCPKCHGTGTFNNKVCFVCEGTLTVVCPRCGGTGRG